MPTHDYIIANGTGAAVRADINSALSAIVSLNSSASEPGTMYAYQLWADTGNNLLKIRNSANSAWITLRQLDGDFSIVAVEDGLLATPSLTFTNDLNTGVFRSGADALAVVTGGQYAITCTSTQAVGIRTPNPSTALHVAGNARVGADDVTDAVLEIGVGATGNRSAYIDIVGDTTYTDYGLRVIRNNAGFNASSEIKHRGTGALNITTQEAAPIEFYTTNSPRLTILAGGNVGIGTSSPWTRMEIRSANVANGVAANTFATPPANLFVGSSSGFALDDGGSIALGGNTNSSSVYSAYGAIAGRRSSALGYIYDGYLTFSTAASDTLQERMRITSAGLVGIGNAGPNAKLHITGGASLTGGEANLAVTSSTTASVPATISSLSSNATLQIFAGGLESDSSRGGQIDLKGGNAASDAGTILFRTGTGTGGTSQTEKARIDSSGRLLVGTIASPAHQLQVSTDSAGKPSTNTWTIVSDERIKEEIELADLDLCYEAVKSIPLKRFKWKDEVYTEEQVRDRRKLGWIAQDVEAVFPKAVGTYEFKYNQVFEETIVPAVEEVLDDEGNVTTPAQPERIEKGELISEDVIEDCRDLNSDQLYAAMYGAIQKLMVKVEALEIEVASLKAS